MARITIEDCLKRVSNRFLLANMASKRVRQIREGSEYLVSSPKNEDIVVSLREIAAGMVAVVDEDAQKLKRIEAAEQAKEAEEAAEAEEVEQVEKMVQDIDPIFIRDEIDARRYQANVVGMALSGPDTGSSQWFITLSPQPHLEGTYTVFGRVVGNASGVQRIMQGDVIRSIHR